MFQRQPRRNAAALKARVSNSGGKTVWKKRGFSLNFYTKLDSLQY